MENDNLEVSLKLTVQQVNTLLGALGNLPYASVAPMIANIHQQAQEQVNAHLADNPPAEQKAN